MRALSAVAPGLPRTPRSDSSARRRAMECRSSRPGSSPARASPLPVAATSEPIPVWIWARAAVLLVHGWGSSRSAARIVRRALVAAGHSVIAFDAPGHGAARERLSSLPQFVFAIEAAAREHGPFAAIVAHSMGGAATTLAMGRGVRAERVVFLAPAADPPGTSATSSRCSGCRRQSDAECRNGSSASSGCSGPSSTPWPRRER